MVGFIVNIAVPGSRTVSANGLGLVTATGSLFAEAAHAIVVDGDGSVVIAGAVAAANLFDGIRSDNSGGLHLTLSGSGVVTGTHAVHVTGSSSTTFIDTAGLISGTTAGVNLLGFSATVVNSGHIAGFASTGLFCGTTISLYVQNAGSIDGLNYGIYRYNGGRTLIENSGTITGSGYALRLDSGADKVTNTGLMSGSVLMGQGDDIFRGQRGMQDDVHGDEGNDQLWGGQSQDMLDGGLDNDDLRGLGEDDTLLGGDGNDLLSGGQGGDSLEGGAGIDVLSGNDGDDLLLGGTQNDRLAGGRGDDTLNGGSGVDTFVFAPGGGQDVVQGFVNDLDKLDLRSLGLSGMAGLTPHVTDTTLGLRIDLMDLGGGAIIVQGLTLATLTAADVLL